ncbi:phosphoglucomutase/phosphomannomutase PgmG [Magnetovibrio sp.]|uniref:phosphoglucomutase/phosphomannomutase PgmG n=1 Tax=Magnetovibrio sp. TaxID=2024836 RepID=UPI002F91FC1C
MSHSDARTLDPEILREYDIRGITTGNFTAKDVFVIGRAFAAMLAGKGGRSCVVGYDGRLSSPELEAALVDGLINSGIDVVRVGRGPTPMLYYAGATQGVDAALMITGSHNPSEYNGIKMTVGGKSFYGEDIQKLGQVAASGAFVDGNGAARELSVFGDYVARVFQDYRGDKELTVAWDPGNGAAGEVISDLVKRLPGTHHVINAEIDGTFPAHHPDPTVEKNLDQLKALVAEHNCDLGFGFDGDGDRIGVIDGHGRVLWGDQIMVIAAREVLADEPGATIIADVKASQVFIDEIERLGGKPMIWKTGHSHIKAKMQETGAPLAGEMSAHIFFKHRYYGFDDAVYTAVRLLSVVAGSAESLADMYDAMPRMINTPEIRIDCSEARKFQIIEEVRVRLKTQTGISVNEIDGVRVSTEDGWWLLRASNTQAVLVARCESETEQGLERLKDLLRAQLVASDVSAPDLG